MDEIYLDTCVLNRITDDDSQPRILAEAEAVEVILGLVAVGKLIWVISPAVEFEVARNPDPLRRAEVVNFLHFATRHEPLTPAVIARAEYLQELGLQLWMLFTSHCVRLRASHSSSPSTTVSSAGQPAFRIGQTLPKSSIL